MHRIGIILLEDTTDGFVVTFHIVGHPRVDATLPTPRLSALFQGAWTPDAAIAWLERTLSMSWIAHPDGDPRPPS